MANFVYTPAKTLIATGGLDLSSADLRMLLVMTATTADTEEDAATLDDFSDLDEMDGSGYARVALTSEAVNENTTDDRAEADADDVTFPLLGAGTTNVQAAIIYEHVDGTAANDRPLFYFDSGFPLSPTGQNVNVNMPGSGYLHIV